MQINILHNVHDTIIKHKKLHITKTVIDNLGNEMNEKDFLQLCGEYMCYIAGINGIELSFDIEYRALFNYYFMMLNQFN